VFGDRPQRVLADRQVEQRHGARDLPVPGPGRRDLVRGGEHIDGGDVGLGDHAVTSRSSASAWYTATCPARAVRSATFGSASPWDPVVAP
jgi:hypothetical protein